MKYLCFYSLWVVFKTFFNYKPNLRTEYCCLFKVTTISVMGGIFFFYFSSAISKHWEAELATLKGNNAKLTAALLESTANVKQWKQQLAAYQEEAERLHKRVGAGPLSVRPAGFLTLRADSAQGPLLESFVGYQNICMGWIIRGFIA